jgi:hypothetical protein
VGRTPFHAARHRARIPRHQALGRNRPPRHRLACPERATATEGTTTATSSACKLALRSDSDEWVKCTIYKRGNSYACTICSSHVVYSPDQLDFFAALVIPADTWYILPIRATNHQPVIVLSPHLTKSKYGLYQEAWHLLMQDSEGRDH